MTNQDDNPIAEGVARSVKIYYQMAISDAGKIAHLLLFGHHYINLSLDRDEKGTIFFSLPFTFLADVRFFVVYVIVIMIIETSLFRSGEQYPSLTRNQDYHYLVKRLTIG